MPTALAAPITRRSTRAKQLPPPIDPAKVREVATEVVRQIFTEAADRTNYTDMAADFMDIMKVQYAEMWEEYIRPAIVDKVMYDIRSYATTQRRAAAHRKIKATASKRAKEKAATGTTRTYYSVGGGQVARLRAMTKPEVLAIADHLTAQSQGMAFKAALLRRIANKMKNGQTVSDVWTDEKLAALLGENNVIDAV